MLVVVAVMIFLTATLAFFALFQSVNSEAAVVRSRLKRFVEENRLAAVELAADREDGRKRSRPPSPMRTLLRILSRRLDSRVSARKLQVELERADILLKGSEFIVINIGVAILLAVIGAIITKGNLLAVLAGLGFGYLLPRAYLTRCRTQRQKVFVGQIADALTVISNSLKAGYSFLQAMEMVAQEMPPPISVEFGRVLKEVSLAVPTETALTSLGERVGSDDLDLVIMSVLIQRQVGGNLSEVLDTIANTIRDRIRIKGEIRTLTAQGRLSGIIVCGLPFALGTFLFLINPQYVGQLFTEPLGQAMLAGGLVSEVIGVFVIRKITNIEV